VGLDLWFREDVLRILAALSSSGAGRGPEYQQALADVAIAFGVQVPAGELTAPSTPVLLDCSWEPGQARRGHHFG